MKNIFCRLYNWILVKRFPFLRPQCGWRVDMEYQPKDYKYHYEETWLDGIPDTWRKNFGIALCKELRDEIKKSGLKDYKIRQVKEKFGELCWYDEGGNKATNNIINKYEQRSREICAICGQPATKTTQSWITYVCDKCYDKIEEKKRKYGL